MKSNPDPWHIDATAFPDAGTPVEKWEFLLRFAILAPSIRNTQPWLFHLKGSELEVRANLHQSCPVVDPDHRELVMSCGCSLFHLRCALRHYGWLGSVDLFPEPEVPELIARLTLASSHVIRGVESALFESITLRRTNRQPFEALPAPSDLLQELSDAADEEGAWFQVIHPEAARSALAETVSEADRRQWADPRFRGELSHWIHAGHSGRRDGIPAHAHGADDLLSSVEAAVIRTFDMGDGQAARNHQVAAGSPTLAVLGTTEDDPTAWVKAGQALARVLLRARAGNLWASFLNQPVEIPELRWQVREIAGHVGFPQIVLRLGFGRDVRPTPRRNLEEVLV